MTTLPPGATDCHVHAFDDPACYPFATGRSYTPGRADAADLGAFLQAHGLSRVVVVQPSVYDTDNRCTLDAVAELDEARAVLVLPLHVSDADLAAYHARGARGVRLNLHSAGRDDTAEALEAFDSFAGRLRGSGWHLQLFAAHAVTLALAPRLRQAGLPVVLDHFGLVGLGSTRPEDATAALLPLLEAPGLHVKLSAPARITPDPEAAPMLPRFVRHLARIAPDRLLWGSDWPHTASRRTPGTTMPETFEVIDDHRALARIGAWLDDEAAWQRMLVDNPARLYGFETGAG
jgi:predicted TIM-barrel fold metal-dependent hydrolase